MASGLAWIIPDTGKVVDFDLVLSESHTNSSQVTDHPVEKGVNVADHVKPDPVILSLHVLVSNTPLEADDYNGGLNANVSVDIPPLPQHISLSAALDAAKGLLKGTPDPTTVRHAIVQTLIFFSPFDKVADTHLALTTLERAGAILTVVTSTRNYSNMVLTKVGYEKTEAGSGDFTLEFKQARVVSSSTVTAPLPAEPRGAPAKPKGSQSTKPTDPGAQTSVAKKALNGAKTALGL